MPHRLMLAAVLSIVPACNAASTTGDAATTLDDAHSCNPHGIDLGLCSATDAGAVVDVGPTLDTAAIDASAMSDGSSTDGGAPIDGGRAIDGGPSNDANVDATTFCDPTTGGTCSGGLACDCCPAGGVLQRCICSTTCTIDADCTDPTRPICQHAPGSNGFCAPASLLCCWLCG